MLSSFSSPLPPSLEVVKPCVVNTSVCHLIRNETVMSPRFYTARNSFRSTELSEPRFDDACYPNNENDEFESLEFDSEKLFIQ